MGLTIGIDVGGTKISGGVVDETGQILVRDRRETPSENAAAIVDTIVSLIEVLRAGHDISAVGIGSAGFVDATRSILLFAPNLAWQQVPLRKQVEERTGLPVVIENDANAAAWGEFRFGAGADVDDMALVTVGTGIGGGLVLSGRLYRGAFGIGAEIGHMRVVPGGHVCGCGLRGCLEQYASGRALEREARQLARVAPDRMARVLELAGGEAEQVDGVHVTQAAAEDDDAAVGLLGDAGRWLGEGIASMVALIDPAMIVIGGGVSESGDLLLEPARAAFLNQLTGRRYRPAAELRLATLGNDAGIVGSADLARQQ